MFGAVLTVRLVEPISDTARYRYRDARVSWRSIVLGVNSRLAYGEVKGPDGEMRSVALEQLADDIRANGLMNPLTVAETVESAGLRANDSRIRYRLVAGFRRYKALNMIRKGYGPLTNRREALPMAYDEVPVRIVIGDSDLDESDLDLLNLAENHGREELLYYELGLACLRIRDTHSLSGTEIAERIGYRQHHVNEAMRCAALFRQNTELHELLLSPAARSDPLMSASKLRLYTRKYKAAEDLPRLVRMLKCHEPTKPKGTSFLSQPKRVQSYRKVLKLYQRVEKMPDPPSAITVLQWVLHRGPHPLGDD